MDWIKCLRQAFDILTLRRSTITAVAADPSAFLVGLSFVVLFNFIGGLWSGFPEVVYFTVRAVVSSFIWAGILYLLARLFGGRGRYLGLWKPMAYTSVIGVLTLTISIIVRFSFPAPPPPPPLHWSSWIVSGLHFAVSVYMFIVTVFILETVMKLQRVSAIAVGLIVYLAIPVILTAILTTLTEGSSLASWIYGIF